jgi:hypothetical protein
VSGSVAEGHLPLGPEAVPGTKLLDPVISQQNSLQRLAVITHAKIVDAHVSS